MTPNSRQVQKENEMEKAISLQESKVSKNKFCKFFMDIGFKTYIFYFKFRISLTVLSKFHWSQSTLQQTTPFCNYIWFYIYERNWEDRCRDKY